MFNSSAISSDDVATCVPVAPKIRSFPKIFLGTFDNAAPGLYGKFGVDVTYVCSVLRDSPAAVV